MTFTIIVLNGLSFYKGNFTIRRLVCGCLILCFMNCALKGSCRARLSAKGGGVTSTSARRRAVLIKGCDASKNNANLTISSTTSALCVTFAIMRDSIVRL